MPDIVCMGLVTADVWAKPINDFPEWGRLMLVDRMGIGIGGCASNTAIDLAILGTDVSCMAKVGYDGFGDVAIGILEEYGVKIRIKRTREEGTSATVVLIDDQGERSFLHTPGAGNTMRAADVDMDEIKAAKILHFAGALVMPGFDGAESASVLEEARAAGVTTSLDVVWDSTGRWMQTLEPALRHADIFMPSLPEAEKMVGEGEPREVAEKLLDYGVKIVALKNGEDGAYVATADGQEVTAPVYPVEVVDGTGSGDAFCAGFLRGQLEGWDLEKATKFGCAAGALCCTGIGTVAGMKPFAEVIEWLQGMEPGYW
jgi:sugar/nucleoside kinase (ribokinase family)